MNPELSSGDVARSCLWCEDDSSPLSREHILPLWIESVLEGSGKMHHAYAEHGQDRPARSWDAKRPDFKARAACERCNHGWMSDLEGLAKPRVARLVSGHARSLSRADCAVLARWAAKTTLMFQAAEPHENRVVKPDAFHDLRATGNPGGLPNTFRVWTGSVHAGGAWSKAIGGTLRRADGTRSPHFTILLTLDRLSLMVMGCEDPGLLARVELGHLANAWIEISHRLSGVRWPPTYRFPADQFPAMPDLLPRLARVA